ncbi:MAG: hypothetical protein K0S33_3670 [Bacteroidetes bacterium]|jgi:environmental stress-induced protein Ves|nr:hypothetical protein [Bacteroidota bacterium]
MKLYHITPDKQVTTDWSGGSSTQLAIFPFESDFKEQTFIFRISTATTNTQNSVFTSFPGYQRLLMVLEGKLHLDHTDQYTTALQPFDVDHFYGGWETKAEGQVRDFNVIFSEKDTEKAILEKKEISKGEAQLVSLQEFDFVGVFMLSGKTEAAETVLQENDFLLVERSLIENILPVKALETSTFLLVRIGLK